MARYSSDTDSDRSNKYRRKHYRRSRSNSSDSSDSSSHRKRSSKHSKSKRRHRSRSRSRDRDKPSRSNRPSRGSSKDRDRRRYRSRKSRSYSPGCSKRRVRSPSRDKSTSRSSSSQSNVKPASLEKPEIGQSKDVFAIEPRFKESVLEEINSEGFAPQQFKSSAQSKQSKAGNIIIDISADTIKVPAVTNTSALSGSIFHTSIMVDRDAKFDKWVKKLYTLRQKAITDLAHTSVT